MKLYQMADPVRYPRMTTAELRETFLLDDLFNPGAHRPRLRRRSTAPSLAPPSPAAPRSSSKPSPNSAPNTSSSAASSAS